VKCPTCGRRTRIVRRVYGSKPTERYEWCSRCQRRVERREPDEPERKRDKLCDDCARLPAPPDESV